ncbi:hypothetical protein [Lewinella sp. IMCC34191]|uniref:hypothetical protein n=1 Tax=Lewinella sp. IMCC34191 TaxID=2259172 RepID=UPI000E24FD1F|nr:hypothetical protein [Lewinella sp. IMCC34191]
MLFRTTFLPLLLTVNCLLAHATLSGQARTETPWSVELEPGFGFALSDVDGFNKFAAVRPLLQLNYQLISLIEPHLRAGYLRAWGPDIDTRTGIELGAGLRVHFAHLLGFKNPWTVERVRLYGFANYAVSSYSLDAEFIPYGVGWGRGQIARTGVGMSIRFTRHLSARVDMGYAYRARSLRSDYGRTGAFGVGWHW